MITVTPAKPENRTAPLAIRAYTATTALGRGRQAQVDALRAERSGLRPNDFSEAPLTCHIGRVEGVENAPLPEAWQLWECRNNRLAWLALQQDEVWAELTRMKAKYGADRVALVIGTSTASIGATEEAYTRLKEDGSFADDLARAIVHTPNSLGDFLQHATELRGPSITVATACSSSAKVFAQAARLIAAGEADAALVGGVDTLCGSVLFGFNSLGLVAPEPCKPFDAHRNGISLGEAGGFAVLERADDNDTGLMLLGHGESSDAYHMSTPHPEGLGARKAMQAALDRAGLSPADVDYLNLHGTSTPANDQVEAIAVKAMFPDTLHAASTKGWTGHTLGAAGIVESVFALIALEEGFMPRTLNSATPDAICGPQIRFAPAEKSVSVAMNNSFGFGGNSCSLVFGKITQPTHVDTHARQAQDGTREARIEGFGFWCNDIPNWEAAQTFARTGELLGTAPSKPSPEMLPANERRRAPESVAVALEVAQAAVAMSGRDPKTLPSIFASTDGDLVITDYVCATLRDAPDSISPTKFHNSVHNAAAGYWTIGHGCMAPSSAVTAYYWTFAQGLMEALIQLANGEEAVVLSAFDTGAVGPLSTVSTGRGLLGAGFVLSNAEGGTRLRARFVDGDPDPNQGALGQKMQINRMSRMLPLIDAMALGNDAVVNLDAGIGRVLQVELIHAP